MSLSLLVDLYELTMAQSYFLYKKDARATFDLFVRELPPNRNYLVSCGLEDILKFIKTFKFSDQDLDYLSGQKIFSPSFLKYLSSFKFRGDIWAMREGEICFANEPIIRVTARIIEAQILESFLLNTINLQSMVASKASRIVSAACGRGVFDFALRRTHGADAAIKVARSAFIAGAQATSNCLAGELYGIPVAGTMAHSFVMSFKDEIDSFRAYSLTFPDKTILLVDTYDTRKGIDNALIIGRRLKDKGFMLKGIRLDSGNIVSLSKLARRKLDGAGLGYVKILASGNLDEFKIKELLEKGARVDSFGVGTNMGTSIDMPCLDVIYKLSEVTDKRGDFLPTMKLSRHKVTFPGRKQVFRQIGGKGKFSRDILGLEGEKIRGERLLLKVIDKGRQIYKFPALKNIREFSRKRLEAFPHQLTRVNFSYKYPVAVSAQLSKLQKSLMSQLSMRQ